MRTQKTCPAQQLTLCKIDSLSWQFPNMFPLPCNLDSFWDYCLYNYLILLDPKLRQLLHICIVCIGYTFVIYSRVGCKTCKTRNREVNKILFYLNFFTIFIYLFICSSQYYHNVLYMMGLVSLSSIRFFTILFLIHFIQLNSQKFNKFLPHFKWNELRK